MSRRKSMSGVALPVLTAALICFGWARPAEAKLLELQLRIHGGGMAGVYGTENIDPANTDPDLAAASGEDFFKERRGGAFGGILNVEVLFVDLTYEFYQLVDSNGLGSTLNNFPIGFDWDFKAGKKWVVTPYLLAGFGLATQNNDWLSKSRPQISLDDLESRMVMARIGLQVERKLGRFFRLGLDVGLGYHYGMTTATAANNVAEGHSHGFHVTANISLAFVWNVFGPGKKKKKTLEAPAGAAGAAPAQPPVTEPPPARNAPDTAVPPPSPPSEVPPRSKRPAPTPAPSR